jgi:hypothetical protein
MVTMKKRLSAVILMFSIVLLVVLLYGLTVETWHIQTVDAVGWQSGYPSLALDSKGTPHMCYNDYVNADSYNLKYATLTGSNWTVETIESSGVFLDPRISLDSHDKPYVLYTEYRNSNFIKKYAALTGSNWTIQTIDKYPELLPKLVPSANDNLELTFVNLTAIKNGMVATSVAFDSKGNPNVALINGSQTYGGNLSYAIYLNSEWHIQTIDFNISSHMPCLVLDSNDYPHIAYIDRSTNALKYAEWTGSDWNIQISKPYNGSPSLALDSNGNAHIACGGIYAVVSDSHWSIQQINTSWNGSISDTQLVLDSAGKPHIACEQGFYHGHGTTSQAVAYATFSSAVESQSALYFVVGLDIFALVMVTVLIAKILRTK